MWVFRVKGRSPWSREIRSKRKAEGGWNWSGWRAGGIKDTYLLWGQQADINEVPVIGHKGHHFKSQVGPWVLKVHQEGEKARKWGSLRNWLKAAWEPCTQKPGVQGTDPCQLWTLQLGLSLPESILLASPLVYYPEPYFVAPFLIPGI